MNKSESKYFNTALKMDAALLSLLEKKSLEFITVKEICDKAGVNRSTFYLHYETIGDLLAETLEFVNQRFMSYFEKIESRTFIEQLHTLSVSELNFITPEYLYPYLTFIKDNRHIFKVAFQQPEIMASHNKFNSLYHYIFEPILERWTIPEEERKYMIQFYIHGIVAIIQEWVSNDCKTDLSLVSDIITKCVDPRNR